jgi:branched-chain amino acid transport system substrate-binding protein
LFNHSGSLREARNESRIIAGAVGPPHFWKAFVLLQGGVSSHELRSKTISDLGGMPVKNRAGRVVMFRNWTASLVFVSAFGIAAAIAGDKQYGPGVTDTEIKLGQTSAYSGPASAYGTISKIQGGYLRMINEQGGINGRKITMISLDDGYSPPKTVEQTRRLVEEDQVLAIADSLGTAPNSAIQEYLNEKHVPHFPVSGASRFTDPEHFPWTMGVLASYETEGRIYAKYILQTIKDPRIAVLYQNDDLGKDYFKGLQDGLGRVDGFSQV